MNAEEKQIIYNLLRKASQNICGYTTEAFSDAEFKESKNENIQNQTVTNNKTDNKTDVEGKLTESQKIQENQIPFSAQETVSTPCSKASETAEKTGEQEKEQNGITMGEIILKIARCTRCSLARTRTNVVPGTGVKNPDVLVIGDAPSVAEDASGLSFTGPAGELMDKMLGAIKLSRSKNCYLINTVKCAPPQNRDPYPEEAEACFGFIESQIICLKPKMILCAGRVAAVSLLKNNRDINLSLPIEQLRGQWYQYNGIPVFVINHPSEILRNQNLKKTAWDDLKNFAAKLKEYSPDYAGLFNV